MNSTVLGAKKHQQRVCFHAGLQVNYLTLYGVAATDSVMSK